MADTFNFTEIHRALVDHYNLDELHTLCADLNVPFEELDGSGPSGKARELIYWLRRRNRLHTLEPHLHGVKIGERQPTPGPHSVFLPQNGATPAEPDRTQFVKANDSGATDIPRTQPHDTDQTRSAHSESNETLGHMSPFSSVESQNDKGWAAATNAGPQKNQDAGGTHSPTNPAPPNHSWIQHSIAFLLGLFLTSLLVWVFRYAPDSLPEFKQRILGIACAIVAGLFTFFFTGTIGLRGKSIKTPWVNLSVTATGGIGVFIFVLLLWWLSPFTPVSAEKGPSPPRPDGKRPVGLVVTPLAPLLTRSGVNEVALSVDGELLASGENSGAVQLWRVKSGAPPKDLARSGKPSPARCVVIGPNGETIAAGSADGKVSIWLTSDSATPILIPSHTDNIYELYFSSDGQRLVSTGADKGNVRSARLWKISGKPEVLKSFKLPDLNDQILTVSPDLLTIAIYSPQHKRIELWSIAENKLMTSLPNSDLVIRGGGAFSWDGQLIAVGSDEGMVRIWQAIDGKQLKDLIGGREATISIAFHPNGQLVAAGYIDGSVRLWNISDPDNPKILKEHSQRVFSVTFSGNGRILASGGEDEKIQLWEVREELR